MTMSSTDPIRYLRGLADYVRHEDVAQMIRQRDYVIRQYQKVFAPSTIAQLDADEFASFLKFENNRHWWGIQRDEARLVSNMDLLRWALEVLLDEDRPIAERIDEIDPAHGPKPVPGLERQVFTPILLISRPDSYGVWNSIAESAMQRLSLWPDLAPTASNGERYVEVNEMLLMVAGELKTDLWTLDALWWGVEKEHDPGKHFTTRRTPPSPRATTSPRAAGARPVAKTRQQPKKAQSTTFLCVSCFQQKQLNLVSPNDPNRCIDCA